MKTLIFLVLSTLMLNMTGQTSRIFNENKNQLFAMNSQFKSSGYNSTSSNKMEVNMKLPKYKNQDDVKTGGLILLISGIAFTSASILESGDFTIYEGETARQIMLGIGIGMTITGGAITLKHK